MAGTVTGHGETATRLASSEPFPPPTPPTPSSDPALNSLTSRPREYVASTPRPIGSPSYSPYNNHSPPLATSPDPAIRSPNPAKRVPRNPADELRSAVNRDVLRSEAKKAAKVAHPGVQRNQSAPTLAAAPHITPPASPTMLPTPNLSATKRAEPHGMPRNPSLDSTMSAASMSSAKVNGATPHKTAESSRPEDVASVVADAGSPEAAIRKLLNERSQAASHNAQLWRLVEKQRTMILGLNRDLEKALKDKEKYRKKARDQLVASESAPSLTMANRQLEELVQRDRSPPLTVATHGVAALSLASRDISIDSRKASDGSDAASLGFGRSDTPLDASNVPSSALPATPLSTEKTTDILKDIELAEAAAASAQEHRENARSPTTSPAIAQTASSPQSLVSAHQKTSSISSTKSSSTTTASSFATKSPPSRKPPPAPLKLASQKAADAAVTNNIIIDPSDSEYEDDPDSARAEQSARGRRKTREEDDREREVVVRQELEDRSSSKKNKQHKPTRSIDAPEVAVNVNDPTASAHGLGGMTEGSTAAAPSALSADPASIIRQQILAYAPGSLSKSSTAPSLLSPGLPMSPRPGDRPLNSPAPRPPNKVVNTIPMSPKSGVAGLPLSPRAPRQPIPMPPQPSLGITSAHLTRAEGYQIAQPESSTLGRDLKAWPQSNVEQDASAITADNSACSPGEIYQGLVTDEYPDLLLPPNALPSIYIKTASSRMKPSRQSYLAPKTADDNPVFTLAVYSRSDRKQLWRVEKTFASLAQLDELIKATCRFRERVPDKILFSGHAPARIDARRSAIDVYFHRMLESVTDDSPAMVVCRFLSTDTIGSDGGDYFGGSVDLRSDTPLSKRPRREGYLTKRGKNFGGWKARYFILDGPLLKYYDTLGGAQLGSIKLRNAQIGKQSNNAQTPQEDEDNQFRHAFLILEPKKKDTTSLVRHVLCAESDEERDAWVDALLQYVDYQEDAEELAAKASSLSAKVDVGPPRSPRLQKSLNDLRPPSRNRDAGNKTDRLQAVGYDDTVAGDAPVMGTTIHRAGEGVSPHDGNFGPAVSAIESTTPSHPTISGPTNLQVISNTGEWGMKSATTPQSKDKKRGLFSGLRGRSSSDLGTNDKPPSAGFSHEHGHGRPVRAVFGAPLADAVEFARPRDVITDLPAVVYRCIEYLLAQNAVAEEGIFRLSGSNTVVKGLKDRFNTEGDVNLTAEQKYYDIHAVASLLKLYFRELPSSILTRELHLEFLATQEKQGRDKVVALNVLVGKLPRANRALLEALSAFLYAIVSNAELNKMNIRNVGIVFAPTLNIPGPLISAFVENQSAIFGPPIDEAESPASQTSLAAASTLPTDLRSPRKQLFSDLPTPAYNQTSFQPLGVHDTHDETGMIPVHPTYATYQVAPQGEGGFGSLNDALQASAPTVYNVASNGVPSARDIAPANNSNNLSAKARRRESAMLGFPVPHSMQKKSSMTQLREESAAR